jgi:hypothetical protein
MTSGGFLNTPTIYPLKNTPIIYRSCWACIRMHGKFPAGRLRRACMWTVLALSILAVFGSDYKPIISGKNAKISPNSLRLARF